MKIILGIICVLVVLFAGGCAVMLVVAQATDSGAAALALIPGGIAALNVLVLMALFGKSQPQRWAFYVLAGLDVLALCRARRRNTCISHVFACFSSPCLPPCLPASPRPPPFPRTPRFSFLVPPPPHLCQSQRLACPSE